MKPEYVSGKSAWEENIPFAFDLVNTIKPAIIVELGVHYGDSYFAFCQAVKECGYKTKCCGVDLFEGDDLTGYYGEEVYAQVMKYNIHYENFSTIKKSSFDDASKLFEKEIDILHIDGGHYYEDVKHDFETWLTKVKDNGIILFHDIKVYKEPYGVWKFWKEIKNKYLSFEFDNKYGLGVLCLGNEYPKEFLSLFEGGTKCLEALKKSQDGLITEETLGKTNASLVSELEAQKRWLTA